MKTIEIANYPGFTEHTAYDLMEKMKTQCVSLGVKFAYRSAISLTLSPMAVHSEKESYPADAIIIATGASPKYLGAPGESELLNRGISTCATCDGNFFKGKEVAVIGGGNTAVEDALYMSKLASTVHIIHRRDKFRAEPMLVSQLQKMPNITYHWNCQVVSFEGENLKLKGIQLTDKFLPVEAAFIAIGHTPNSEWCANVLETENGYIKSQIPHTAVPGIFVAGDVADHTYRQAITAAGQGCMAAMEATKFLNT